MDIMGTSWTSWTSWGLHGHHGHHGASGDFEDFKHNSLEQASWSGDGSGTGGSGGSGAARAAPAAGVGASVGPAAGVPRGPRLLLGVVPRVPLCLGPATTPGPGRNACAKTQIKCMTWMPCQVGTQSLVHHASRRAQVTWRPILSRLPCNTHMC